MKRWKVWKTVVLGINPNTGKSFHWEKARVGETVKPGEAGEVFRMAFEANDRLFMCRMNDYTMCILQMPEFTIAETTVRGMMIDTRIEVDLVKVSVKDLGFKKETLRAQVCAKAEQLGLGMCPLELGPQLRIQDQAQPKGEGFYIGMEPVRLSGMQVRECQGANGDLMIWYLSNGIRGLELAALDTVNDKVHYSTKDEFVFVLPRKKK